MAKWEINDNQEKTYKQVVYSVANVIYNKDNVVYKKELAIPNDLKDYSYVKLDKIIYIRNFNSINDVNMVYNNLTLDNFGTINNIEINHNNNIVSWSGNINNYCSIPYNNLCSYGVVFQANWTYK